MIQTQTGFAEANDGRLYYEIAGAGHPLVLIHAGVADCRMWDDQFGVFARYYRVIRYDLRGFGKTQSEKGATFSHRGDLHELLKHLGINRTFLIGLSMGGGVALDFALEHPENVAALVPVASGLSGYEPQPTDDLQFRYEQQKFSEMDQLWEKKENDRLIEMEVEMWVDGPRQSQARVAPAIRDKVREMNILAYTHDSEELKPQRAAPPASERLGEIHVPTLVMYGDLDTRGVIEGCELLASGVANARKVVIPGVAHMVNMEVPEQFNQVTLDFLRGLA